VLCSSLYDKDQTRSFVLRLYDNRARQTSRSPDACFNSDVYPRGCRTVLDVKDEIPMRGEIRQFRDKTYYSEQVFFATRTKEGRRLVLLLISYLVIIILKMARKLCPL